MQGSTRIDELRQKFHENPRRYFAPLANEYRKAGDPEQAIAICRAHLAQQPGHMSGHVVYAQSLYDAQRVDESRVVFEKALSLDPDNAIVLRYLGDISRQRGDSAEALHWYSRALEADPHDSQVAAYIAELTEPLTESSEAHAAPAAASEAPPSPEAETPAAPLEENVEEQTPEAAATATNATEPATASAPAESDETKPEEAEETHAADADAVPEPAKEPEVVTAAESPFVTRTMAELYASQGHREAALEVFQKLAAANPDDTEIAERIKDLSAEASAEPMVESAAASDVESHPTTEAEAQTETAASVANAIPEMEPVRFDDLAPPETTATTAEPAALDEFAELTDFEADLTFHSESEAEPEQTPETVRSPESHFTETEIEETHKWDDGAWGEDLSSGDMDITPYDFTPSDSIAPAESLTSTTDEAAEKAPSIEEAPEEAPLEVAAGEQIAAADPAHHAARDETAEVLEIADYGAAALPLGVLNDAREETTPEDFAAAELAPAEAPAVMHEEPGFVEAYHEEAHAEESLVAYSPQPPDEDELPHYEPQGPTIREFFATLGHRRPPPNGAAQSFTAHAAVPVVEPIEDLPLASDAFSSLFADSHVSEDDTRAAFALSGALAAQPRAPEPSQPRATPQSAAPSIQQPTPAAPPPAPAAAQESEEDIRRFREWLDGLADA